MPKKKKKSKSSLFDFGESRVKKILGVKTFADFELSQEFLLLFLSYSPVEEFKNLELVNVLFFCVINSEELYIISKKSISAFFSTRIENFAPIETIKNIQSYFFEKTAKEKQLKLYPFPHKERKKLLSKFLIAKTKTCRWRVNLETFKERCMKNRSFKDIALLSCLGNTWVCKYCLSEHTRISASSVQKHMSLESHKIAVKQKKEKEKNAIINSLKRTRKESTQIISSGGNRYELTPNGLTKLENNFNLVFFNALTCCTESLIKYYPYLLAMCGLGKDFVPNGYIQGKAVSEMLQCISEECINYLLEEGKKVTPHFGISFDKGTIGPLHLISVSSYIILKNKLRRVFSSFEPIVKTVFTDKVFSSENIAESVRSSLRNNKINIKNGTTVVTDGANDVVKAAKLLVNERETQENVIPLYQFPCGNHHLEICMNPFLELFESCISKIQEVYVYFAYASRMDFLKSLSGKIKIRDLKENEHTIHKVLKYSRSMNLTRWSGLRDAVNTFENNLFYLYEYINKKVRQLEDKPNKKEKQEIKKLENFSNNVFSFEFMYELYLLKDICEMKGVLEKLLQDINTSYVSKKEAMEDFVKNLEKLKSEYIVGSNLMIFMETMEKQNNLLLYTSYINHEKGKKKYILIKGDECDSHETQIIFQKNVDECVKKIKTGFLMDENNILKHIQVLSPDFLSKIGNNNITEYGVDGLRNLFDYAGSIHKLSFDFEEIKLQYLRIKKFFLKHISEFKELTLTEFFVLVICKSKKVPYMRKIYEIFSVFLDTEAGDETNFSIAGYIHSERKYTMSTEKLNAYMKIRNFFSVYDVVGFEIFSKVVRRKAYLKWLGMKLRRKIENNIITCSVLKELMNK